MNKRWKKSRAMDIKRANGKPTYTKMRTKHRPDELRHDGRLEQLRIEPTNPVSNSSLPALIHTVRVSNQRGEHPQHHRHLFRVPRSAGSRESAKINSTSQSAREKSPLTSSLHRSATSRWRTPQTGLPYRSSCSTVSPAQSPSRRHQ